MGNTYSEETVPVRDFRVPLDESAYIDVKKYKLDRNIEDNYEERNVVSYRVDGRNCKWELQSITENGNNSPGTFIITIFDALDNNSMTYSFFMGVERTKFANDEGHLLKVTHSYTTFFSSKFPGISYFDNYIRGDPTKNTTKSDKAGGGGVITETSLNPYKFNDKQRGLVVVEWKKKDWYESPHMIIVTHYFASLGTKHNTGASVVVKIHGSGVHAFEQEGPLIHPAPALFQMFDQVLKTGFWTPSACPHCANPNPRLSSLIENKVIKGDGNGNLHVDNLHVDYYGKRSPNLL